MTLESTTTRTPSATIDCRAISPLARMVSGSVSVSGLGSLTTLVKAT